MHFITPLQGIHLRVVGVCDSKSLVVASDVLSNELNDNFLSEVFRVKVDGSCLLTLGGLGNPIALSLWCSLWITVLFISHANLFCCCFFHKGECQVFKNSELKEKVIDVASVMGKSIGPYTLSKFATGLAVVDYSSSSETVGVLTIVVDLGCCIILANKKPLTSSVVITVEGIFHNCCEQFGVFKEKEDKIMELYPSWLRKLCNEWDLRVMVILSITLQIILIFLGNRRKYSNKLWIRIVVWSAYTTADSIATFALVLVLLPVLVDNHKYSKVDLSRTYLLIIVAVIHDKYEALLMVLSDTFVVRLIEYHKHSILKILNSFPLLKRQIRASRWSNSMSQYNLLRFTTSKAKPQMFKNWHFVVSEDLRTLIFTYVKEKAEDAETIRSTKPPFTEPSSEPLEAYIYT
ncbi:hypothetical protein Ddye_012342 [Dipteronia dyeriana]|uniref:DUF4220 domain-containing protein n=1 Tax=Dipteronia dyeriana TaxID=168575 RepID=A0AAD9X462_9ROSI|nr:hypothetical protein Ddye_012342 [Dipteronia dyeriana]